MVVKIKEGILHVGKNLEVAKNLAGIKTIVAVLNKSSRVIIGGSLFIAVLVFWPIISEEAKFAIGQTPLGQGWIKINNTEVSLVSEQGPGKEVKKEKPDWKIPDENYSVYIPKIQAKSKVIPNVDPGDKSEYQWALKLGVAEAAGMAHPGEIGTTYLFAHSVGTSLDFVRYNAVFYLLHKLDLGNGVEIYYKGNLYRYKVSKKEILVADDLRYLVPQKDKERLVLQTCYPPGTAWKRLIVVADPVDK